MQKMTLTDETASLTGIKLEQPQVFASRDMPKGQTAALDQRGSEAHARPPLKKTLSQKNSGIHEPENSEGEDDHYILSVLDPTDNRATVWAARALLFWCVYFVGGFYITFQADSFYWSVGLGAVAAYCLCIGCYLVEAYVIIPWWYESSVGRPMVHWFSWGVFLDIIYHVVNPRNKRDCRVETYAAQTIPVIDEKCSGESGEFWMDFCADVGDGFNPTFAVFSSMARSHIVVEDGLELPRANAVVVGGDIAYPWPRHEDILARFLRPLSWAFPEDMGDGTNKMYVMPGNHEWADGLRNFRRMILERTTGKIGAWTVGNCTPYFCMKLPFNWWMFCLDPGNEASQDLDDAQYAYFKRIVEEQTGPEDRFILALHEPDWIKNSLHGFALFEKITKLRNDVLGERLKVTLAGDLHYYRRMEETAGAPSVRVTDAAYPFYITHKRQLIVAGHGGAFSHPTYVPNSARGIKLGEPYVKNGPAYHDVTNYPTPEKSRAAYNAHWLDGFSFGKNYGFGAIVAMSYIGMALAVNPMDYSPDGVSFPSGNEVLANASYMLRMLKSFWFYPAFIFLSAVLFIVATTSAALRTPKEWFVALSMALFHISLHLGFLLVSRKLADALWATAIHKPDLPIRFGNTVLFCFLSNVTVYVIGYFVAPYLTAIYLYISQNVVQNAYNEPMSTIEHQEDKGFCRMRFTPEGDIELFSIGIRKTPRKWKEVPVGLRTNEFPSHFAPADMDQVEPFIVERVLIKRDNAKPVGESESPFHEDRSSVTVQDLSPRFLVTV